MNPTFRDYVAYFFVGYKLETMNQSVLAVLRGFHYVIAAFLASVFFSVLTAVSQGKDVWDIATWQTAATGSIILAIGILYEMLRKYLNPSVSVKTLEMAPTTPLSTRPVVPFDVGEEDHPTLREIPPEM